MPFVPKTYNRNTESPKFYSTATGHEEYNPAVTYHYNNSDELLQIEETFL